MNGVVNVTSPPPPPPPPPILTSVSPAVGPTAGGTDVSLGGSNFIGGCTVTFGGIAAATTFVNQNALEATTPAHAAGAVDLVLTCSSGSSTLPAAFLYSDAPPTAAIPLLSSLGLLLLAAFLGLTGWMAMR